MSREKLTRYEIFTYFDREVHGDSPLIGSAQNEDGQWVLHSNAQRALDQEREKVRKLREALEKTKEEYWLNEEALMNTCDCIRGFNFLFDENGELKERYQDQLSRVLEKVKLFPDDWKRDAAIQIALRRAALSDTEG